MLPPNEHTHLLPPTNPLARLLSHARQQKHVKKRNKVRSIKKKLDYNKSNWKICNFLIGENEGLPAVSLTLMSAAIGPVLVTIGG